MSETRIVLLYSTRQEASHIMEWAGELGLTGKNFVWIATQSVIGESKEPTPEFPAGMLGTFVDSERLYFSLCGTQETSLIIDSI